MTAHKGLRRLLQAAVQMLMPLYMKQSIDLLCEVLLMSLVQCLVMCGKESTTCKQPYS